MHPYDLKAGTRIIYTDVFGHRFVGYFRFPAQDKSFLVVTRERHGSQSDVIHKTDVVAVA